MMKLWYSFRLWLLHVCPKHGPKDFNTGPGGGWWSCGPCRESSQQRHEKFIADMRAKLGYK